MHHPIVLISLAALMLDMDILERRVEDMDWDLYNVVQLFSYLPLLGALMLDMDILERRVEDMDWDLYNVQLASYPS